MVICWHKTGLWLFDTQLNDTLSGLAIVQSDELFPHKITKTWKVLQDWHYISDNNIQIYVI
jgi:hypothetical protein